jgi:molybdopterin-guanine dinucleotide biosynthesis protein A
MDGVRLVTGVLLAGGRGRRLGGVDKPALRHPGGETLLVRAERSLRAVVDDVAVWGQSTAAPNARPDAGQGPARAVVEASRAARHPWLLVVAADLVRPQPGLLRRLIAAAEGNGAWVERGGRWAGLPVLLRTAWVCERPASSFRAWLADGTGARIRWSELSTPERYGFEDVDRPADRRRFRLRLP